MTPTPKTLAAALAATAAAAVAASPATAATPTRVPLRAAADQVAQGAALLGPERAGAPVQALVGLRHRDEAGLKAFIARVSDPHSPSYGHYLSPSQFEARYAPSDATLEQVEGFLKSSGLKVEGVPRNRAFVQVTGTAAAAQAAFGAALGRFSYKGTTVHAPLKALTVPAALQGVITGVTGLDTSDVAHPDATPPPAFVNAPPCTSSFGEKPAEGVPQVNGATPPQVTCGYTPQQLQGAYGTSAALAAGLDGRGQRVAIIDAYSSPQIVQDATQFSKLHGLPDPMIELHDTATQRNAPEGPSAPTDIPVVGGLNLQDPQGWAGEETLDVEAVHAMAPGATIVYQGAESPLAMFLEMAQNAVVSGKLAQIVSNSYGGTSDTQDETSDGYWMQAAAQGMGVYFSSGDSGDETLGSGSTADRTVDGDGNSPYVTSVGGTSLAVDKDNGYGFETYWGTYSQTLADGAFTPAFPGTFNSGGGGGTSQVYGQPDYQKGVVPDRFSRFWEKDPNKADDAVVPGRSTPDVAMVGDPNTGMLVGLQQDFDQAANPLSIALPTDETKYSEYRLGGTSLSSPLMAGVMALADQAAGKPHGFANPAFYALHDSAAFHDVTAPEKPVSVVRVNYNNSTDASGGTSTVLRTTGQTQTLASIPGYDDSTGLGTPNGLAFLRALAPGSALIPSDTPAAATPAQTTPATTTPATTTPGATPKPAGSSSCTPPKRLRFTLHAAKGQRVVRAVLKAGGKTITRKGRKLTRITITRPRGTRFTVVVTTRSNKGAIKRSTRTYTKSGCVKGKVKTTHPRR